MPKKATAFVVVVICLVGGWLLYRGHKESQAPFQAEEAEVLRVPETPPRNDLLAAVEHLVPGPVQSPIEMQLDAVLQPPRPAPVLPSELEEARRAVVAAPNDPVRLRRLAELEAKAGHEREAKVALARAKRAERNFKPEKAISRGGPGLRPKGVRHPPPEKKEITRVRGAAQGQSGR